MVIQMAIGNAIHYTQDELESQSQIAPADIELAIALWLKYASSQYRNILSPSSQYKWDASKRQYVNASGDSIDPLTLRNNAIEPFITNIRIVMRGMSTSLQEGKLSLQEWQTQTIYLIKYSQIASALVANGGADNTTKKDNEKIVALILILLLFHLAFAIAIETGEQLLNGTLLSRTGLYADAIRDAYEETRRQAIIEYTDKTLERRILDPEANHCHTVDDWTGCPELADLGFQPIGTLPRLMDTPCLTHCRCSWEFA